MKMNDTLDRKNKPLLMIAMALPVCALIFGMLVFIAFGLFEIIHANKVFPGVTMQDVDLSGLTLEEAQVHIAESLTYSYTGQIQIAYGDQYWDASPIDLGYVIEPAASAQKAYQVGRDQDILANLMTQAQAWFQGIQLSPVVVYDEGTAQQYLSAIAIEVNRPVVEASLSLQGTEVVVNAGQVGREVDVRGSLALLTVPLVNLQSGIVSLIVEEIPPAILDASAQAEMARQILREPLVITLPAGETGGGPWTIQPEDLANMLTIVRVEDAESGSNSYQVALNQELISIYLNSLSPTLYIEPVNPRFIFNDDTGQLEVIQPAVIGRELDILDSIEKINTVVMAGEHTVPLVFRTIQPVVTDDTTGEELGITELVFQETSYFYGSDSARIQNIDTASSQFHGLLIPPGETFSMAEALGNVSLENGYAEALIIYGDQTIQGVGGGVCQVSTTLFRTAFFAGFPIVERHAHAYRVGYYEMRRDGSKDPNLAGLDATVYVPIVDLKFINDTDNWLLMETYMGQYTSLTWKFYSTSDGRTVDWNTTGPTNIIPAPDPVYRENPDLNPGEIEQVDYAADGAEINITRTVYRNGTVLFSDSFYTLFQPWQAVFEYGPGTDVPNQND